MDYALPALATLKACPFCREMFSADEAKECPLCGVALTSLSKLGPSNDPVDAEDDLDAVEPEDRQLAWTHFGNGRGPLLVCCVLGLVAFALPWVYMHAPDEIALNGPAMAKRAPPVWAAFVSWFTLLPMVLSRRTLRQMRGIRYATAFLASLPAVVATIFLLNPPQAAHIRGVTVHLRFTWGAGIFAALAVSVIGTLLAGFLFGKSEQPKESAAALPSREDMTDELRARLSSIPTLTVSGRVESVTGLSLEATLPGARIGDLVSIQRRGGALMGEIVGFKRDLSIVMPLGDLVGVGPDDVVEATGRRLTIRVSRSALGRVVDGLGRPMDGGPPLEGAEVPVDRAPPPPLGRRPIDRPLATGVRPLDALLTLGEGQRVGLFAGSGVGKSTLLGAMARGTEADIVIVALVGERGREVNEFLEHALGAVGRQRSIVVVATSDAPALERLRAAQTATAMAESFRDEGLRVLLLVDSVTRFARAQREVGLAAGEPPARRGYPPSVFALLPRLLERTGQGTRGSITAVYTVLVEGGDMEEPIADEVRGVLDGHIVLDRAIAARGRYPAIDVPVSLSRVMDQVVAKEHREAARAVRAMLGAYEAKRDLLALGAYAKGADPLVDRAIARMPLLEALLAQQPDQKSSFAEAVTALAKAAG